MNEKRQTQVVVGLDRAILNQALMQGLKEAGLKDILNIDVESKIWAGLCEYFGIDWESD